MILELLEKKNKETYQYTCQFTCTYNLHNMHANFLWMFQECNKTFLIYSFMNLELPHFLCTSNNNAYNRSSRFNFPWSRVPRKRKIAVQK